MSQVITIHPKQNVSVPANATWPVEEILARFDLPFNELMRREKTEVKAKYADMQ